MARAFMRSMNGRRDYLNEAMGQLVTAPSFAEAFGALAHQLMNWASCELVVLQVKVDSSEPLLFQGGIGINLPGIGVGWRTGEHPQASALSEREFVVHGDLHESFDFGEDANLIRMGLRSAVRGALFAGGQEIGRFGLFAEKPGHFTPELVQIIKDVEPALIWVCRQASLTAEMTAETAVGALMDEVITASGMGLHAALRVCRNNLSRLIPAAGVLVMIETPSDPPAILIDQVGIPVPGVPQSEDLAGWRHWLGQLPPEGYAESVAWVFPISLDVTPVGALAIAFPKSSDNQEIWRRRLRPMISFLSMLVEFERLSRHTSVAARSLMGALASGLSDDIGNLMTELALQVDLLQAYLPDRPEARQRSDALMRLVEKGTSLSSRLEQMAASQRNPKLWEPLAQVIERVAQNLRTYQGGRHIALQSRLGEVGGGLVESGLVEQAVTQLVLSLAQSRSSEVKVVVRGSPSPSQPAYLRLWVSEEHYGEAELQSAESGDPDEYRPVGLPEGGGAQTLILEVPVRMRS